MDLTKLTTTGWQKYMSFIGDFASAGAARSISNYNSQLTYQQAQYARKKAEINKKYYNQVTLPLLKKQQEANRSNLFVNILRSGAEFREGTTPYEVMLENNINQAFNLVVADYNKEMDYEDQINQSLLLESKSIGEREAGRIQSRALMAKGVGSLLTTGYNIYQG